MPECPRCQAPLIDADARFCPNCGAPLPEAAEPVAAPDEGEAPALPPPLEPPPAPPAETRGTPWDRRAEIGLGAALIDTTRQVLFQPQAFFRSMPVSGGLGGPFLYAVIVGYVGLVAAALYDFVFRSVMGPSLERFGRNPELEKLFPLAPSWIGLVMQVVLGPALVAVLLFVFAGITHLMLMLLGGAHRDFEATFRVASYARATHVLQIALGIIPVCGALLVGIYSIVVAAIGLSEVHGISRGKAVAAILLPLLVFCCCAGAIFGVALWGVMSALGTAR
jgi:hypothetical protein